MLSFWQFLGLLNVLITHLLHLLLFMLSALGFPYMVCFLSFTLSLASFTWLLISCTCVWFLLFIFSLLLISSLSDLCVCSSWTCPAHFPDDTAFLPGFTDLTQIIPFPSMHHHSPHCSCDFCYWLDLAKFFFCSSSPMDPVMNPPLPNLSSCKLLSGKLLSLCPSQSGKRDTFSVSH